MLIARERFAPGPGDGRAEAADAHGIFLVIEAVPRFAGATDLCPDASASPW